MEQNPYQPPTADLEGPIDPELADAEAIRKAHINHEASVRSVGLLYYIGTFALAIATIGQLMMFDSVQGGLSLFLIILFVALAWLYYWIGTGLRNLNKNVSIVAGIFAILGLLSFPLGTIINGYILYLLFSEKGKLVFSEEYQHIVAATPHIKYKTPVIVWIFLALLILAIGAAVVIPVINDILNI